MNDLRPFGFFRFFTLFLLFCEILPSSPLLYGLMHCLALPSKMKKKDKEIFIFDMKMSSINMHISIHICDY